jgi:hypothetical protein
MPEFRVFASSNPFWSRQTQGGGHHRGKRFGWCAAASAIWCSNVLAKGKKPGDSRPDEVLAGIMQVKYRWDPQGGGQDTLNLLALAGLRGHSYFDMYLLGALHRMETHPGVYHFSNDEHSMAADTRQGHYYWYDIENGLFVYDNLDEWKAGILGRYRSGGRVWSVVECGA